MNKSFFKKALMASLCGCCLASADAQVTLNIDAGQRGPAIGDRHYGIFFEEINHAGDGGLYAELIQNRSFEDNASNPDKWWTVNSASMNLVTDNLLNSAQEHALRVQFTADGDGVRNEGFWGINIVNGRTYKLSLWAKSDAGYNGQLRFELQKGDGTPLGTALQTVNLGAEWQKVTAELTATGDDPNGWFALTGTKAGTIDLDVVSLFPPTFKGRDNGCRIDLAEMLAAMKPAFVRFPGGCYVEGNFGNGKTNRFEWKNTVGPIEERPGHLNNNWGYNVSDGFGFHEMLQLTEDLGAEPLFVVNMGMGHGWMQEYNDIEEYIQEALDAIEYCNGDAATTKWGALRAQNGHPEPFNLRLLEIGNENYNFYDDSNADQSDHYAERYYQFYKAIKAKYPEVMLIGNVESWGTDAPSWRNPYPVEAVDEHYYRSPDWFVNQYNKYDTYSRSSYKVYVGEYAVTQNFGTNGHLTAALGEAVYMQGMENNSDVCIMNSYAPIFVNENHVNPWRPDMIRFNSAESYGTPSYYVQQLMPNHIGKQNVKWTEVGNASLPEGVFGLSTWNTIATFDNVKITNGDGTVVFSDDFSSVKSEWSANGGTWNTEGGELTQNNYSTQGQLYVCNVNAGTKYTFEVDATKIFGAEGFLIAFNYADANNYCWWNLGGWNNSKHGVEVCTNGNKTTVAETSAYLENDRTYHIKIEVDGNHVVCSLDNQVVHDFNLPGNRKVYVSSSIDDEEGIMYLKLVNPSGTAQSTTINMANATITGGTAVVLAGASGLDENTTDNPRNVAPVERALSASGQSFTYEVPAYSLNILRLNVSDVTVSPEVKEDMPEPLVKYSFESGTPSDDGNAFQGELHDAVITTMDDGNKALYLRAGSQAGYMDLGADMARKIMGELTGDYSISVDMLFPGVGNLTGYCWAYGLCNGTDRFVGLINSANNTDWYYSITNGNTEEIRSGSGLTYNEWHNVTVTREGNTGRIYVDGYLLKEATSTLSPADMASAITEAYIGRSPFSDDACMVDAYFDNFQVFGQALSAQQAKQLYEAVSGQSTRSSSIVAEADMAELKNFALKLKFLHATTELPAETANGTPLVWTLEEGHGDYIAQDGNTLVVNSLPQGGEAVSAGVISVRQSGSGDTEGMRFEVRVAPDDGKYGYLYCFMNANREITNYALGSKESKGQEFNVLLGGEEIFNTSELAGIEGGTRDAFICRGEGDDGYFMTTTDMQVAVSGSWYNHGMNLLRSDDLIHWESTTFKFTDGKQIFSDPEADTGIYTTDEEYANINRVWAPQVIWDKDYNNGEGAYLVYYSLLSSNDGDDHDRIFYSYANRDFTTLTQPRLFFDPGISVIDGDIVYNPYDGLYHMFYKREAAAGSARGIYEATSPRLVGGEWTDVMHVTNEGSNQVEGSSCIRRINEDVYNLYYMRYSGGSAYKYCETDHMGLNPTSSAALKGTGAFQHGSFMTVTEEEYVMLQAWSDVKQLLPSIEATRAETGSTVFDAAIAQAKAALDLTDVATLSVELPKAYQALLDAQEAYKQDLCDKADANHPADLTFLLVNPDFSEGSTGWSGTSFTDVAYGTAEQWNKSFDNYQILKSMPDGDYRFLCQGFYRYGTIDNAYAAHRNGTEALNAELYINNCSAPFISLYAESDDYTYRPYTYPDNISGASAAFNTDDNYHGNVVDFRLEQKGDLRVGMRNSAGIYADWTCFDNFHLYYLGGGTGINEVNAPDADAPVDVYTLSGVKVRSGVLPAKAGEGLPSGIYIIGNRKVVVK